MDEPTLSIDDQRANALLIDPAVIPSSQEAGQDDNSPSTSADRAGVKTENTQDNDRPSGSNTPHMASPSRTGDVESPTAGDAGTPNYTANATTVRRNANGSVSSVYSGNKIRHLKKDDGVPLWRRDIQYDFLKTVFEDEMPVFHKQSENTSGHTFAEIYLDAMAKSSKCSRILKDKLLTDRPAGVNMAMVCLLVNVGRMNTTLNFFPEMRAQLRTYHSIPSLQAHQDANAYKQLQDAPRLKSILKGAMEDDEQPGTIEDIKATSIPRTNPVNLIFVLAQQAPKISEMHFDVPRDFFDLVMKEQLSSGSRARAFLWLMWWYLESDFTLEAALNNPYGPGRRSRDAPGDDLPIKCPQFDYLTDEEAALENVDTPEELEFGEIKRQERLAIINGEVTPLLSGPKRFNVQKQKMYPSNPIFAVNSGLAAGDEMSSSNLASTSIHSGKNVFRNKTIHNVAPKHDYTSDSDGTRQTSPASHSRPSKSRTKLLQKEETPVRSSSKGPGRGNWRRNRPEGTIEGSSLPPSATKASAKRDPITTVFVPVNGGDPSTNNKRARPLTSHQIAVENFRKQRVSHIVSKGLRSERTKADRRRARQNSVVRAWKRIRSLDPGYDSEEEAHMAGAGRPGAAQMGIPLAGFQQESRKKDDYGAEAAEIANMFGRFCRRDDPEAAQAWREAQLAKKQTAQQPQEEDAHHESTSEHSSDSENEAPPPAKKTKPTIIKFSKLMTKSAEQESKNKTMSSAQVGHGDAMEVDDPHGIPQFRPHPPLHTPQAALDAESEEEEDYDD